MLSSIYENAFGLLPENISSTVYFKKIDLRNCNLKHLSKNLFKGLWRFDISGNPWHCNCDLEWLIAMPNTYTQQGRCASPEKFEGMPFDSVEWLLECNTHSQNNHHINSMPVGHTRIVGLIFIGAIIFLLCCCGCVLYKRSQYHQEINFYRPKMMENIIEAHKGYYRPNQN